MKDLRKELTIEEEQKPYAKYFHQSIAAPNSQLMKILKQGQMNPANTLMLENINDLLNDGYGEVETGYCVLPNGSGYVAELSF
ncbi:hypothetical protein I6U48_17645 [Clostridium sp. PL3]|uniref:DAPG hydrolase PhiG domain-containing protein n=1 Tax=Clostridium thailandense TaxID=2794346 RepID=A0A949TSU3_9CLOT|nr:hypothetical protein [Clostridium thailandense]